MGHARHGISRAAHAMRRGSGWAVGSGSGQRGCVLGPRARRAEINDEKGRVSIPYTVRRTARRHAPRHPVNTHSQHPAHGHTSEPSTRHLHPVRRTRGTRHGTARRRVQWSGGADSLSHSSFLKNHPLRSSNGSFSFLSARDVNRSTVSEKRCRRPRLLARTHCRPPLPP